MSTDELYKRIQLVDYAISQINGEMWWYEQRLFSGNSDENSYDHRLISTSLDWCSWFIMRMFPIDTLPDSVDFAARSWLRIGIRKKVPMFGDLVVFWRKAPDSWQGHVSIFIGTVGDKILCLGGNQNNQVKLSLYDIDKLIDYVDITEYLP
jgi:hypothetical protein